MVFVSCFLQIIITSDILKETCRDPPWKLLRPSWKFWEGLFSLEAVVERLRELLPPTFEDLNKDFAVAVLDKSGRYTLVSARASTSTFFLKCLPAFVAISN